MISKEKLKYEIKEHLADSTSIVSLTLPLSTAIDTLVAEMTNDVSINSRFYNIGLTYAGLARVIKLRDYTKKKFGIDNCSSTVRVLHDVAYGVALGPLIKTGVYLASGETDWGKIAIGVSGSIGIIGALCVPLGWVVDVGRDCWGIEKSPRTPAWLKEKSVSVKKAVVVGALAVSLAVTSGLYVYNSGRYLENDVLTKPSLEQVVELDAYKNL